MLFDFFRMKIRLCVQSWAWAIGGIYTYLYSNNNRYYYINIKLEDKFVIVNM